MVDCCIKFRRSPPFWAVSDKLSPNSRGIQVEAHTVPENGHPDVTTCDGVFTYATITGLTTSRNLPNYPSIAGSIKKDMVPFNSGTRADCVWLALASGCYLGAEKPGLLSPAWLEVNRTESSLLGDRFRAQIARLPGEPRLPQSINCWANGFGYGRDGRDKIALPPPLDKGYLCLKYRANATTNLAGLQIPVASTISFLRPRLRARDMTDIEEDIHVELSVEEASSPSTRSAWRPVLGARTRIKDFRFVTAKGLSGSLFYETSAGPWPNESDPVVRAALVEARDRAAIASRGRGKAQIIRLFVLGAMALTTLIIFLAQHIRSRQPAR